MAIGVGSGRVTFRSITGEAVSRLSSFQIGRTGLQARKPERITKYSEAGSLMGAFNGLDMNIGNLYRLSNARTRSDQPETSRPKQERRDGDGGEPERSGSRAWGRLEDLPSIKIAPGNAGLWLRSMAPSAVSTSA